MHWFFTSISCLNIAYEDNRKISLIWTGTETGRWQVCSACKRTALAHHAGRFTRTGGREQIQPASHSWHAFYKNWSIDFFVCNPFWAKVLRRLCCNADGPNLSGVFCTIHSGKLKARSLSDLIKSEIAFANRVNNLLSVLHCDNIWKTFVSFTWNTHIQHR